MFVSTLQTYWKKWPNFASLTQITLRNTENTLPVEFLRYIQPYKSITRPWIYSPRSQTCKRFLLSWSKSDKDRRLWSDDYQDWHTIRKLRRKFLYPKWYAFEGLIFWVELKAMCFRFIHQCFSLFWLQFRYFSSPLVQNFPAFSFRYFSNRFFDIVIFILILEGCNVRRIAISAMACKHMEFVSQLKLYNLLAR